MALFYGSAAPLDELWPLLQEYCYEDPNKLANILAADKGGVFDRETANLRFELFEPGREDALAQALTAAGREPERVTSP